MRGCLVSPILVLLLVANGYAIWQIHAMRGEIAELRAEVARRQQGTGLSMIECARDAAEAVGRGELGRAEADLRRIGEILDNTRQMAQERRERVARQLAEAEAAVSRGSSKARQEVDDLVRILSPSRRGDRAARE